MKNWELGGHINKKQIIKTMKKNKNFNRFKNFRVKKTTVWLVALVVVFGLMGPWTIGAKKAEAFSLDWGALFSGASKAAAGSMTNGLANDLGSGFLNILDKKFELQDLYVPAMQEFTKNRNNQYAKWSGIPDLFTQLALQPQKALSRFISTPTEKESNTSFQDGDYRAMVVNAQEAIAYQEQSAAARSTYAEGEQAIRHATNTEVNEFLGNEQGVSKIAGDIAATNLAGESGAMQGYLAEEGGGFWGDLFGAVVDALPIPGF